MLRLILGRAGYGKTGEIYRRIRALAEKGDGEILLLVPEQASAAAERDILHSLGASAAGKVEVLSFTRLAHRVFTVCGGLAGDALDDGGRTLLMAAALRRLARGSPHRSGTANPAEEGALRRYGAAARRPETIRTMLDMVAECKQRRITAPMLRQACDALEHGAGAHTSHAALRDKLNDYSLVLAQYDALVNARFRNSQDTLDRLADCLRGIPFFADKRVFIDGFKGFTEQQYAVLREMLRGAEEVCVSLPCDGLMSAAQMKITYFAGVDAARLTLERMADELGVGKCEPVRLTAPLRTPPDAGVLRALEELLPLPAAEARTDLEADGSVRLFSAGNPYDEADFAARTIRRLVRTQGLRYRDFAVLARNLDDYADVLSGALTRYGVPFHMARGAALRDQPAARLLEAALDTAVRRLSPEGLAQFCHTDAAIFRDANGEALGDEDIAEFENYLYVWDLSGGALSRPFEANPAGLGEMDDAGRVTLARVNRGREAIMRPLAKLRAALEPESLTAEKILRALYALLMDVEAPDALQAAADACEQDDRLAAEHLRESWDALIALFDQTALCCGDTEMSVREFAELFGAALQGKALPSPPQGLDGVLVGAAGEARPGQPRVTFVLGMNEGTLPRAVENGGALTRAERAALRSRGLPVSDHGEEDMRDENFLAYAAVCSPSDAVYLTAPRMDTAGNALEESPLFAEIRRLFPAIAVRDVDPALSAEEVSRQLDGSEPDMDALLPLVEAEEPAFEWMARRWPHRDAVASSLMDALRKTQLAPKCDAFERACAGGMPELSGGSAKRLYGDTLRLPASPLERFYRCPFSYFCRDGLRAAPLERADVDARERGSAVHFALERVVRDWLPDLIHSDDADALRPWLRGKLAQSLRAYRARDLAGAAGGNLDFLLERAAEFALEYGMLLGARFRDSGFQPRPALCEVGFGARDGDLPPYSATLPGGGRVVLAGRIDRVDAYERDGTTYLCVTDYKTSALKLNLSDVIAGLHLQMLLYLFALLEQGEPLLPGQRAPAGMLYQLARLPRLPADGAQDAGKLADALRGALKATGLLVEDMALLAALEPDGHGDYVPYALKKDGVISARRSSVLAPDDFDALLRFARAKFAEAGERILSGDIAVAPTDSVGGQDACALCDYAAACGIEPGQPHRRAARLKRADALARIRAEIDNG